eukprot:3644002-Pyramimonas_sp.AAC.1
MVFQDFSRRGGLGWSSKLDLAQDEFEGVVGTVMSGPTGGDSKNYKVKVKNKISNIEMVRVYKACNLTLHVPSPPG